MDTICTNDKQVWRTIRKELQDIGITVAAFDANKDFIFEWFMNAISSGAFDGRPRDDFPTAKPWQNSSDEVSRGTSILSLANAALMVRIFHSSCKKHLSDTAIQGSSWADCNVFSKDHKTKEECDKNTA